MGHFTHFSILVKGLEYKKLSKYQNSSVLLSNENGTNLTNCLYDLKNENKLYYKTVDLMINLNYYEYGIRYISDIISKTNIDYYIKSIKIDDYDGFSIIHFSLKGTYDPFWKDLKRQLIKRNQLLFVGCELMGIVYSVNPYILQT